MADMILGNLVVQIQRELYQVAGIGTQIYSEDLIVQRINDAFITFFEDKDITWKRFLGDVTYTLNGTTGEATTSVDSDFLAYEDIISVFPSNSDIPLNLPPSNRNPALITGSQAMYVGPSSTAHKIFRVLPLTATGNVVAVGKLRPATWPFDDLQQDTVPFDYLAIAYYVCWQMTIDDSINSGGAEKFKAMYTNRYKQVELGQNNAAIALNGYSGQIPQRYYDNYPG